MRFELMYDSFFKILKGVPLTLEVVFLSTIFGLVLAVGVALMRVSKNKFLSKPAYYFIYTIRGTPLLLQLFWVIIFLCSPFTITMITNTNIIFSAAAAT